MGVSDIRRRRISALKSKGATSAGFDSVDLVKTVTDMSPSDFLSVGFDYDLNNVCEIASKIHEAAKPDQNHWTFLNILRHLLLIPANPQLSDKVWSLLEVFVNGLLTHLQPPKVSKLELREFLFNWKSKNLFVDERTQHYDALETSLKVLFPSFPPLRPHDDATWTAPKMTAAPPPVPSLPPPVLQQPQRSAKPEASSSATPPPSRPSSPPRRPPQGGDPSHPQRAGSRPRGQSRRALRHHRQRLAFRHALFFQLQRRPLGSRRRAPQMLDPPRPVQL